MLLAATGKNVYILSGNFHPKRVGSQTMVKVLVRKLNLRKGGRRYAAPASTLIRDSKGKISRVFTIEVTSTTFENDLTFVYKKNVAKARSENKKLFGSPNGIKKLRVAK